LNEENAAALFEACRVKTRRQIEHLLAARVPRPDVRGQIRRLPAPSQVRVEAISQPLPPPHVFKAPRVLVVSRFVKAEEKRRFCIGTRPRPARSEAKRAGRAEPASPPGGVPATPRTNEAPTRAARPEQLEKRTRHVSAQVRREIHARDGTQCAFVSPDGRRCNATALLEFDRVKPFA